LLFVTVCVISLLPSSAGNYGYIYTQCKYELYKWCHIFDNLCVLLYCCLILVPPFTHFRL